MPYSKVANDADVNAYAWQMLRNRGIDASLHPPIIQLLTRIATTTGQRAQIDFKQKDYDIIITVIPVKGRGDNKMTISVYRKPIDVDDIELVYRCLNALVHGHMDDTQWLTVSQEAHDYFHKLNGYAAVAGIMGGA